VHELPKNIVAAEGGVVKSAQNRGKAPNRPLSTTAQPKSNRLAADLVPLRITTLLPDLVDARALRSLHDGPAKTFFLAIKRFGDGIKTLQAKAGEIEKVLNSIEGNADVSVEPLTGLPLLQVKIKQDEIARHGVPAKAVLDLVESLGSMRVGEIVEGQFRFPLVIRLPEKYRGTVQTDGDAKKLIEEIPVITAKGERLPLSRLASVEVLKDTPSTITREWGQRRITVTCKHVAKYGKAPERPPESEFKK
jgi:multidrug efflux pump subunit AcrB